MNASRGALVGAYLVAMGWVAYRDVRIDHQAPQPRTIVRGSLLYGLIGISEPLIGDKLAATLGWGLLAATILRDVQRGANSGGNITGPDLGGAPHAQMPPPGTPPGTPPYVWGLPAPGVPDPGSRPSVGALLPSAGLRRRTISV